MVRDFQALVSHFLAKSFYNPRPFMYNSSQCNNLCYAFIAKLSTYFASNWQIEKSRKGFCFKDNRRIRIPKLESYGRKIMEQSWEEVYRVVKEAEIYLTHCSENNCLIKSSTLSSTGEAHAIHIHDLAWSLLCLDLNILFLQGEESTAVQVEQICAAGYMRNSDSMVRAHEIMAAAHRSVSMSHETRRFLYSEVQLDESYNEAACRKMGDFRAEMSNLTRIHDEYQDKRALIFIFQRLMMAQRSSLGSTENAEEKSKREVAQFLAAKLQASIRSEPAIIGGHVSPWLQIDPNDLIIDKRFIGEGSSGHVYEGSWHGVKVAVKEFQIAASEMDELMQVEVVIHAKLHSPFIVQLIGVCVTETRCYLVMELVSSSLDKILKSRLEKNLPPLPLRVAVDMMLQISRGMEYLHSQKTMHMDLKASNVLIEPSSVPEFGYQGYGRVKLCDFGESTLKLYSFRSPDYARGTYHWRAPEVFKYPQEDLEIEVETRKEYTYKADVYSFAMTCYEILTNKQPFHDVLVPGDVYRRIVQGRRPSLPPSCLSVLADLIRKCWDTDPQHRPCFAQVSNFMRYMKLSIMRMSNSSATCESFDKHELFKCGQEGGGIDERVAHLEEERLIIRALDGEFPGFFLPHPLLYQRAGTLSPRFKVFDNLPDNIQQYPYEEIVCATDCFSRSVSGASGVMWKGILSDGTHVAVKKQVTSEISMCEINILCQMHHPNVVRLRGISSNSLPCGSKDYSTFVAYDHMVMCSLSALLFRPASILNWNIRKMIGLGIAHFIAYIQDEFGKRGKRFLDLQVSSSNIYLDERFTPKFCGFESVIPIDINNSNSGVSKLELALQFQEFRNVKDFGIILLELLTGCRWENMQYSLESIHSSIQTEGSGFLSCLLDRELQGKVDEGEAMRWVKLALWCFSTYPAAQPTMNQAVLVMKGVLEFSALPPTMIGWSHKERFLCTKD